jgi:DNA-binding transcriptional MocR family regulator
MRRVELVPPVARYAQVARHLRGRIYAGEWVPGTTLPGAPSLSREYGVTQSVAQRALETLETSGLVRMESGRGSIVLDRRRWKTVVTLRRADGGTPSREQAEPALAAAAAAEPAVEMAEAGVALLPSTHDTPGDWVLVTEMMVLASDVAVAVAISWGLVRDALRGEGGWDLDEPNVSARPA